MMQVSVTEAWLRKYPEQVAIAVSVDKNGKANMITLGWVMPTSGKPPMVAVSIGHGRYSHELISECGEFVLAFPSAHQKKETLFCGSQSGRHVDKVKESGFEIMPAVKVKPPLLKDCVANFECKVVSKHETGDHTIFVGEIVNAHVEEKLSDRLYNFGNNEFGAARMVSK